MPIVASSNVPKFSPELMRLLARAKLINQHYEKDFDISFSSMLLAFLVSDDAISRWFSDYVKTAGIDAGRIIDERKVSHKILQDIASRTILPNLLPLSYRQTTSTTMYLAIADKYRESLAGSNIMSPLQVHHLMAVYIYEPWVHKQDLIRWGFDRMDWSNAFLIQMSKLYPIEFDFWKRQHHKTFLIYPDFSGNSLSSNGYKDNSATLQVI